MSPSLLSITDLSAENIFDIFSIAEQLKTGCSKFSKALHDQHYVMLFEKPSLRTRASFSVGIEKLGGHAHFYDLQNEKLGQRESILDFTKNLEQWYQGIIARVDEHSSLSIMQQAASIPVVNALSNAHHPCQALADFFTLYEKNPLLSEQHLVYCGNVNNVSQSLIELANIVNCKMSLLTPESVKVDPASSSNIHWVHDPESIQKPTAVYTDVWQSMGEAKLDQALLSELHQLQINETKMRLWNSPWFLHCQPVHRGEEVSDEVCDSALSLMYEQAKNRMFVQQALLILLTNSN